MADVKEKIKKLLALATSPVEAEAQAALLKAKELMAKNKLSEVDFEEEAKLQSIVCDDVKWTTDSGNIWMTRLCELLAENYCCTAAWRTYKGTKTHTLQITGLGKDPEVCAEVIRYAVGFVQNAIKILQRKHRTLNPKSVANSYAEGFNLGLELAFEEQKEDHPEWGLVVVKPKEVQEYEESLGNKKVRTRKTEFDALAYMKGQNDGSKFNAKKVIGCAACQ